jgi:hypothetical protein
MIYNSSNSSSSNNNNNHEELTQCIEKINYLVYEKKIELSDEEILELVPE